MAVFDVSMSERHTGPEWRELKRRLQVTYFAVGLVLATAWLLNPLRDVGLPVPRVPIPDSFFYVALPLLAADVVTGATKAIHEQTVIDLVGASKGAVDGVLVAVLSFLAVWDVTKPIGATAYVLVLGGALFYIADEFESGPMAYVFATVGFLFLTLTGLAISTIV